MVPCMASTKPREMARPSPGPGAHMVAFRGAVELVEYMLQILRRNTLPLVDDLEADGVDVPPALNADRRAGRRILGRIVQNIEQHLLHQHRVQIERRKVRGERQFDPVLR